VSDVEAASRRRLMEARSKNHSASRLRKASASFSHCDFQKGGLRLPLKRRRNLRKQSMRVRTRRKTSCHPSLLPLPGRPACRPRTRMQRTARTNVEQTDKQAGPPPDRRAALARSARRLTQPERTSQPRTTVASAGCCASSRQARRHAISFIAECFARFWGALARPGVGSTRFLHLPPLTCRTRTTTTSS